LYGGLVEEQEIVPACNQLGQGQLRLLAARKRARILLREIPAEAEHPEQRAQLALVGV